MDGFVCNAGADCRGRQKTTCNCTVCHLVCLDALLSVMYICLNWSFSFPPLACENDLINTPLYFIEKDVAAKRNSAGITVTVGEGVR